MRCLLFLALLAAGSLAQQCPNQLSSYMFCLKDRLDADYQSLEAEFRDDYISLAGECFDSTKNKCNATFDGDYTADYALGSDGPLRGCRLCNTLSRAVRGLLEKASEKTMTCVRGVLREGITEALEPCIQKKVANYKSPRPSQVPDFDAASFPHKKSVMDSVATVFLINSNVQACRAAQGRALRGKRQVTPVKNTRQCLDARQVNGRPIWTDHCQAMKSCRASKVTANCKSEFVATEGATCNCIDEGSEKIKGELQSVGRKLVQVLQDGGDEQVVQGKCESTINDALVEVKKELDIDAYMTKIIGCVDDVSPQIKGQFNINSLVKLGCRALANGNGSAPQKAGQLSKVLQLGTQLITALVSRVNRFCPGAHCQL